MTIYSLDAEVHVLWFEFTVIINIFVIVVHCFLKRLPTYFCQILGTFHYKGWGMVLLKLWVSQNFCRISQVSQSRFFIQRCLGVLTFCRAKGLEVPIRFFKMTSSRHFILNFIKATFNFREKVNPNFIIGKSF